MWVTAEPEGAGFQAPADVKITICNASTEALLLRGEIDALIPPNIPASFKQRDPRIRRVFNEPRKTITEYFQKTRIFPITHTLVMRQSLFDEHPWIAASLLQAFTQAEDLCHKSYDYAKRLAFPSAVLILEEEEELFGKNPWAHGLTAENRIVLEKRLYPLPTSAQRPVCACGQLISCHGAHPAKRFSPRRSRRSRRFKNL
jgi:4,5-dihydroxyphthalate decarboxylase